MAKSYLNSNQYNRGIRNNNPANLIYSGIPWQGKIPYAQNLDWSGNPSNIVRHFEQFTNMGYGIRAAAMDIVNDYYSDGMDTISALVYERSPAFENSPEVIISHTEQLTGLDGNTPFQMNANALLSLLHAFFDIEIGPAQRGLITDADIVEGINMMPANVLQQIGGPANGNQLPDGSAVQTAGGGVVAFGLMALLTGGLVLKKMRA